MMLKERTNPLVLVAVAAISLAFVFFDCGTLFFITLCLGVTLLHINRNDTGTLFRLARFCALGIFFLTLFHAVHWENWTIDFGNLQFQAFVRRVAGIFSIFAMLFTSISRTPLYSNLLSIRFPATALFVLFRAFGVLPSMRDRASRIFIAQQLRGVPVRTFPQRVLALAHSFSALFNSMVVELEDSSVAIASRGVFLVGLKVPFRKPQLGWPDFALLTGVLVIVSAAVTFS